MQAQIDEAWPGDLDSLDLCDVAQTGNDLGRQFAGFARV